jgi:hypothetical protein
MGVAFLLGTLLFIHNVSNVLSSPYNVFLGFPILVVISSSMIPHKQKHSIIELVMIHAFELIFKPFFIYRTWQIGCGFQKSRLSRFVLLVKKKGGGGSSWSEGSSWREGSSVSLRQSELVCRGFRRLCLGVASGIMTQLPRKLTVGCFVLFLLIRNASQQLPPDIEGEHVFSKQF